MIVEPEPVNPHEEPCRVCGEETAIGSVFFSDRREGKAPDGRKYFLCSECTKRVSDGEHDVDLDDPDFYRSMVAAGMFSVNVGTWIG